MNLPPLLFWGRTGNLIVEILPIQKINESCELVLKSDIRY